MKGKLLIIEGTDCSGKATQTELLVDRLKKEGKKVSTISCPYYDTPSGRIVGACVLGKPHMCEEFLKQGHGFFEEHSGNIDPLTALCYYAADRRYNLPKMQEALENSDVLIADRYTTSNMAHRGGMIDTKEERMTMYKKIETLEYDILELPRPDAVIFLHMPNEYARVLRSNRTEKLDESESDEKHLIKSEQAYLELAEIYGYKTVSCVKDGKIKTIDEIHE